MLVSLFGVGMVFKEIYFQTPNYPGIHPVVLLIHHHAFDLGDSSRRLLGTVALTVILQPLDLVGANAITQLLNQVVETDN